MPVVNRIEKSKPPAGAPHGRRRRRRSDRPYAAREGGEELNILEQFDPYADQTAPATFKPPS
ncbi:hypothetical protein ACFQ9J_13610 [Streptomyces sp. NPDC056529]|uniref:hypothetical protein n=1 Tax=Streptomyces sp. NPDC056529 TaxID=3345855 RepID=UPI0036C3CD13